MVVFGRRYFSTVHPFHFHSALLNTPPSTLPSCPKTTPVLICRRADPVDGCWINCSTYAFAASLLDARRRTSRAELTLRVRTFRLGTHRHASAARRSFGSIVRNSNAAIF